jgi:hypothetical protein
MGKGVKRRRFLANMRPSESDMTQISSLRIMAGGLRMDALSTLFEALKQGGQAQGNFLGLLHVFIGRTITKDKAKISSGLTWRELAGWLKKVRWDPEMARELGIDPKDLPPRDRQRYWYSAIMQAKVDSAAAIQAGDKFAATLRGLGYEVTMPGK